ncbi:MAG: hypothetical protein R3E95_09115 [Thiolinea sp.]
MENYQNRQPPEGINTSPGHPLLTFLKLLAGMALVLAVAAWVLAYSGSWLASLIPFEQEQRISRQYLDDLENPQDEAHPELQAYLDQVANRLLPALQLPEGMQVRLHYAAEDVENAYATLGGISCCTVACSSRCRMKTVWPCCSRMKSPMSNYAIRCGHSGRIWRSAAASSC